MKKIQIGGRSENQMPLKKYDFIYVFHLLCQYHSSLLLKIFIKQKKCINNACFQASWGLIGNLQPGQEPGGEHGFPPTPTSSFPVTASPGGHGGALGAPTAGPGGPSHVTTVANTGAAANSPGFMAGSVGWGGTAGGEGAVPAPTPPQNGAAGTWSSQPRDRQGKHI